MPTDAQLTIVRGYVPGAIGRIAELHAIYYARHWRFGLFFEAKVATELARFLESYDEKRDGIWLALKDGRVEGGIVIDGSHAHTEGAHLRWFILSEKLHGLGTGRGLIGRAVEFCRSREYPMAYLWTFEGLHAARRLYEAAGFRLIHQQRGAQWGTEVNEQRFECRFL